jgi:hypothetical protein
MSRHFRPWTIDQTQLLPAAVVDYVPADHLAQFVVALAREHLDLTEIVASYKSGLGHQRSSLLIRRDDERILPGGVASDRAVRRRGEVEDDRVGVYGLKASSSSRLTYQLSLPPPTEASLPKK